MKTFTPQEIVDILQANLTKGAKEHGISGARFAREGGFQQPIISRLLRGNLPVQRPFIAKLSAEIERRGWDVPKQEEPVVEEPVLEQNEPQSEQEKQTSDVEVRDPDIWETALMSKAIMDLEVPRNDKLALLQKYVFRV